MKSIKFSRRFFGWSPISQISAALAIGGVLFTVDGVAQETEEHRGMPTRLQELVQEVEQKNPRIAASVHAW